MSWETVKLGDFLTLKRGYDLPSSQRKEGAVPIVSSSGITGYHNVFKVSGPGVVTGRYGTLGEVFFVKDDYWPLNTALYVKDFKGNDRRFTSYFLQTVLNGTTSSKAAVPGVNRNDLHARKVNVTRDVRQQRAIADFLSAYDDLIENNRRRIQLLEQAARLLYKEWFVRLRFPGHEHVKIKNGIPEGWEKVTVSSFCTVGRGGSPRPIKDFIGGTIPWFKIGDATASESPFVLTTAEAIIESGVNKSVLLSPKELVLSNSATCGIPYFTGIAGCIHDGWLHFKNLTRVSKWFLYCFLYDKQRAILAGIGEGATQKNLNTDYIGRQSVLLPRSTALLDCFDGIVEPLLDQIFVLAQTNIRLRQARDLLLPRLMNGEIEV